MSGRVRSASGALRGASAGRPAAPRGVESVPWMAMRFSRRAAATHARLRYAEDEVRWLKPHRPPREPRGSKLRAPDDGWPLWVGYKYKPGSTKTNTIASVIPEDMQRQAKTYGAKLVYQGPDVGVSVAVERPAESGQLLYSIPIRAKVRGKGMHTIQLGPQLQWDTSDVFIKFTAHGRIANIRFIIYQDPVTRQRYMDVRAAAPLRVGDILLVNYNSFEWEISCPFTDTSSASPVEVRGFKHCAADERSYLEDNGLICEHLELMTKPMPEVEGSNVGIEMSGELSYAEENELLFEHIEEMTSVEEMKVQDSNVGS